MEIDETGWHDLNERLKGMKISFDDSEVLIDHLVGRLVGHFGTDSIECFIGKDDPRRHSMREVAAAALAHLAPLVDQVPTDALAGLIETGGIGATMPPPWDDHWRSQGRTASWRS